MFGSPETTTGGRALKFYASMRLDIRRIGSIKEGEETTGNRTRLRVVKNKVAPPFRSAEFDILYGEGISKEGDLIDLGIAQKIVDKAGSWFSYGEIRLGQGRENARVFLKDNPDLAGEIDRKIRAALGLVKGQATAEASPSVTQEAPRAVGANDPAVRVKPRPEAVRLS
jgi:recombination protein RecA